LFVIRGRGVAAASCSGTLFDEASGRVFYGNVKTGATQFERPQ